MIEKEIRLYTEFMSLIVPIEFPSQKIGYRFRLLEQIFFSQSISKIIEILNKHSLTVLSNTYNYFIKINEISEVDYDNKLRIFEDAFRIYLSVEGIERFEAAPLPVSLSRKIKDQNALIGTPQFLNVPVLSNKRVEETKQKKFKRNFKAKNKKHARGINRTLEKTKKNAYGIRARIIYTGMKN